MEISPQPLAKILLDKGVYLVVLVPVNLVRIAAVILLNDLVRPGPGVSMVGEIVDKAMEKEFALVGFNTNSRMPVRPTASMWLSPVWTPATSNSTSRSTTNQSPDMTLSPPPRAEVYLVENRLNPISTRAALELTDDNLRCTVKEYSKWVEKALGISDLRSRLQAGEAVAAFDFRRDQLKIKWLKQFLKAGFSVSEGSSRRWLVSLVYPTGIMALVEVVDGWDVHNEWRRALPPT